ncbi:hypothetical protein ACNI65_09370 [Roseateles sp. So40a]|uniref:hypothetical protein n=1 Tax=Roseateles sp. So40a TaxID=3400226 RepID=UPI003A8A8A48
MNLEQLIPFLADSTDNDRFDDLIQELGFKARPKGPDLTVFIRTPDKKVTLEFSARPSFEETFDEVPKSAGSYLLAAIESETGGADLPFGLTWEMPIASVKSCLGEPAELDPSIATFIREGLQVTCRFKDKAMTRLSSVTISLVDVYAKKRLGL